MNKLTIVGTIRFENTPISDFRVYFDLTHFLVVNNGRLDIVNEFQPLCTIILKRVALVLVRCWIQSVCFDAFRPWILWFLLYMYAKVINITKKKKLVY